MRLAVVDDGRKPQLAGEVKLPGKDAALDVARNVVVMVIQPDLADGDRLRMLRQPAQHVYIFRRRAGCLLRVYADSVVHSVVALGKRLAHAGGRQVGGGVDDMRDSFLREQRRQQRVAVAVEARVVVVGVRIQHRRALSGRCCRWARCRPRTRP